MKKIFTFGFLALTLLLTGCGNDKPAPENKNTSKQESHQSVSESKSQSPSAEITDEEKARQEAERKAMEEKQRAEAEQREQQRKIEEEEKKNRQYNAALAKTLRLTPEEFRQNFNELAYSEGVGELAIGDLKSRTDGGRNILQYFLNEHLWINFPIDSITKNAKSFELLAGSKKGDINELRDNLFLAVMLYTMAIRTADAEISLEEINKVFGELGLNQSVGEWAKDTSYPYKGKIYSKRVVKGVGIKFSIEQP